MAGKYVLNPSEGWDEAFKQMHENGDDELLFPDVFEDEKLEDMKKYRLIWILADGRKKYSTKRDEPEVWTDSEIEILKLAIKQNGKPVFDSDLFWFAPNRNTLLQFGYKIIECVSYELEDINLPLRKDVIL